MTESADRRGLGHQEIIVLLVPLIAVYLSLVLNPSGLTYPVTTVRFVGGLVSMPMPPDLQMLLYVLAVSSLGGFLGGARPFATKALKDRRLETGRPAWARYYLVHTVAGSVCGASIYLVLRMALFSPRVGADSINVVGITMLSTITGLFSQDLVAYSRKILFAAFSIDPNALLLVNELDERLKQRLETILLDPVLDNYSGLVSVELRTFEGTQISAADGLRFLSAGHAIAAVVQFHSVGSGPEIAAEVSIQSGRDSDSVLFDIEIDSETLTVSPHSVTVSVHPNDESDAKFFVVSPREARQSSHTLSVQIFQKNRLIQIVPVNIGEPHRAKV